MKKVLLSSVAFLGLTAGAMAADLPSRTMAPAPAPMISAVPVFTWTGFYVGVNAGWIRQNGDAVVIWPCHGGANQRWTRTASGELQGINGRCLDVLGGRPDDLTPVWLWDCLGADNQRWDPRVQVVAAK